MNAVRKSPFKKNKPVYIALVSLFSRFVVRVVAENVVTDTKVKSLKFHIIPPEGGVQLHMKINNIQVDTNKKELERGVSCDGGADPC